MTHYIAVEEQLFSPILGYYRSWGIAAVQTLQQRQVRQAFVSDVSLDGAFTAELAHRFTQEQLQTVHLKDVVLDLI